MITRLLGYTTLLLAALGAVYVVTREPATSAPTAGGHNHAAMAMADSAAPVTLSPDQARRIGVTYAAVTLGPLEREVRTVGEVVADESRLAAVSPKFDGFVDELYVNATGQPVAAGQPLMAVYSPMLVQAQEELLLAARLLRDTPSASTEARTDATTLLDAARKRLAYWDIPPRDIAAIEQSGQVRRTLTLRANASGHVIEKNVVVGQRIMAGDVLFRLADLRRVWVEGEVFEQDLANVRVGQMVHADLQALPGTHRMGRISTILPTLNPETRTARVRVAFDNADLALKPGMYATLRITGTDTTPALTVPRDAILSTGERHVAFVRLANGQLMPREVAIGAATDTRIEVLRGLAAGDTVVASATFLVDAESNLGKALGGMGDMPGMDMTTPPAPLPMTPGAKPNPASPSRTTPMSPSVAPSMSPHAGHKM